MTCVDGKTNVAFVPSPTKEKPLVNALILPIDSKDFTTATNVSRTLGWFVQGHCFVKCCPKDRAMNALGTAKRVGTKTYKVSAADKKLYRDYVIEHILPMFDPIEPGEHLKFDEWLEGIDFNQLQKQVLSEAKEEVNMSGIHFDNPQWLQWFKELKGFVKDEFYPCYKANRWINARGPRVKTFFGPLAQDVMDVFKQRPEVIKTVPVAKRAEVIYEALHRPGAVYHNSDYTSYESHFEKWLMEIEGLLYYHILRNHPRIKLLEKFFDTVIGGLNCSQMRGFGSFLFLALRCSGEMNTSLGNTFHNFCKSKFLTWLNDPEAEIVGFVEGDDGLYRVTPESAAPTAADYARFGWIIKVAIFENIGDASFCGNVFEIPDFIVVTDPREVMLKLGWTPRRYLGASDKFLMSLLRSKALSLAASYGQNPILWALAKRLLELTEGVKVRKSIAEQMSWYDRLEYREALANGVSVRPPPLATRNMVERLYGIPVDLQLQIESELLTVGLGGWTPPPGFFSDETSLNWMTVVSSRKWTHMEMADETLWKRVLATQCSYYDSLANAHFVYTNGKKCGAPYDPNGLTGEVNVSNRRELFDVDSVELKEEAVALSQRLWHC